jgi:ketosteroid isomerase-like protein
VSQENVKLAQDAFAAYNCGGTESMLEYFDPNVELVAPPNWPEDRVLWGHDGLRKVVADWNAQFDDFHAGPERIIDAHGSGVVVLWTLRGHIKGSDREVRQPVGMHWEFHEGKVRRWHAYLSWDEALKAVGLEE